MSEQNLPEGWLEVTLEQVFRFRGGGTPDKKKSAYWNGDIPWASVKDVKGLNLSSTIDSITKEGLKSSATSLAKPGDVIVVTRISPGETVIPTIETAINQDLKVVSPEGGMPPLFIRYLFKSLSKTIIAKSSGTTVLGIRLNELGTIGFGLPPLNEQKRIVAKIEELFSELDAGEESLRRARRLLGVYRQSLLKQAFEGKLTAQWRKQNLDQLTDDSWREVEVSEVLTSKPTNGRSVKDRTGGFKVLRLTALKNGKIDLREYKEGDWDAAEAANHVVRKGNFLLSRGNGSIKLVGRGGVVLEDADIAFPDTMIRLPLDLRLVEPPYFVYLWNSEQVRRQIESSARTTAGIYKINQSLLTRYRLTLCSLPEQQEIVRLLDEQFTVIDQNEREIAAALKRSEALRQSILKKAFTGQLVPQNLTDEPASVLLERIRTERATHSKSATGAKIPPVGRKPRKAQIK